MSEPIAAAEKVILQHVIWSIGAGLVPVPIADFLAVTAVQVDLIRQLCTAYGTTYSEAMGKVWIGALTGGTIARIGASAIKAIPGIGTFLGGLSMSIASGASTYAVGQVVSRHLAGGGTMGDFNVDAAKVSYEAAYEEGKKVAKEVASKTEAAKGDDTFIKLEKLGKLRESGVITQGEFDEKKAKLLGEL